jgi:hypothetical protein
MRSTVAELKLAMQADKKKASVLALLSCVLAFFGGRALLGGPSEARAQQGGDSSSSGAEAESSVSLMEVVEAPAATLEVRDFFSLDPDTFPKPPEPQSSSELVAKPQPEMAEGFAEPAARERERVLARARELLSRLELGPVVTGPRPAAVIQVAGREDGRRIVRAGDRLGPLRVVLVEPGRVEFECEGVELELVRLHDR